MQTKQVEFYFDLYPGWQDGQHLPIPWSGEGLGALPTGYRRVKVVCELPCFGGTADVSETVTSTIQQEAAQ